MHLLMGLPGAGKSTLAKHLQHITKAARLSSDEFRLALFPNPCFSQVEHDTLYAVLDGAVETLLKRDQDVIYDANLNRRIHRDEKYDLARKYSAKAILWYVTTPDDLARMRRLAEQNPLLIPDGETPENLFDRVASVLEQPKSDEVVVCIDGTTILEKDVRQKLDTLNT